MSLLSVQTLYFLPDDDVRRHRILIGTWEVPPPSAEELSAAGRVRFEERHRAALWGATADAVIAHGEWMSRTAASAECERCQRIAARAQEIIQDLHAGVGWPCDMPGPELLISMQRAARENAKRWAAQRASGARGRHGGTWATQFAEAVAAVWRDAGGRGAGASRTAGGRWSGGAFRTCEALLARVGLPAPSWAIGAAMIAMRWDEQPLIGEKNRRNF